MSETTTPHADGEQPFVDDPIWNGLTDEKPAAPQASMVSPAAVAAVINLDQLKEFIRLENEKKRLTTELDGVKAQLEVLNGIITNQFVTAGTQSMSVDKRTVYLARDIFASPRGPKESVIEALKSDEDLAAYVSENYNAQSLSAYVREVAKEVEAACNRDGRLFCAEEIIKALPESLRSTVNVFIKHIIRSRKA